MKEREDDFQSWVIDFAHWHGWRVAHFRPAKVGGRWMTPVSADGAGFPDLVLVRGGRVVYRELKADGKYPDPDQRVWLDALEAAGQDVGVWRPVDRAEIERELT